MKIAMPMALFRRLPRHPDWRVEYWDGHAVFSHRPNPIHLVRSTTEPVDPGGIRWRGDVRQLEPAADWEAVEALVREVWPESEPYCYMDPETVVERIDVVLARSARRLVDPPGVVAYDGGQLVGVVLVERGWSLRGDDAPSPPELTWLSVRADHRHQGVASAMLAKASGLLRDSGMPRVASSVSGANIASLRWHWRHGFAPQPGLLSTVRRQHGD